MAKTKKASNKKRPAGKKAKASAKSSGAKSKANKSKSTKTSKPKGAKPRATRKSPPGVNRSAKQQSSVRSARGTPSSRLRGAPARRTAEVNSASTRSGPRGVGPDAGGQSGDLQGLSRAHDVDSESVEELLEEGQGLEAGVVSGVAEAAEDNADESEVTTDEPPEEKIPKYRNRKSL